MSGAEVEFTISELAARLAISPSSIRFYEDKGLILPKRTAGNQRVYTRRDRARLKLILRGKRFGFSLEEIARMIGLADAPLDEVSQIENSLGYAQRKLDEIAERKTELALLEQDLLTAQKLLIERKNTLLNQNGRSS